MIMLFTLISETPIYNSDHNYYRYWYSMSCKVRQSIENFMANEWIWWHGNMVMRLGLHN